MSRGCGATACLDHAQPGAKDSIDGSSIAVAHCEACDERASRDLLSARHEFLGNGRMCGLSKGRMRLARQIVKRSEVHYTAQVKTASNQAEAACPPKPLPRSRLPACR